MNRWHVRILNACIYYPEHDGDNRTKKQPLLRGCFQLFLIACSATAGEGFFTLLAFWRRLAAFSRHGPDRFALFGRLFGICVFFKTIAVTGFAGYWRNLRVLSVFSLLSLRAGRSKRSRRSSPASLAGSFTAARAIMAFFSSFTFEFFGAAGAGRAF